MSPEVTREPCVRSTRSLRRCLGTVTRPCAGTRPAPSSWVSPRATRSSARPISQSRLGTTSPAGVKAILRSSAWLPESLRHSPLTMSTASLGLAANSSPAYTGAQASRPRSWADSRRPSRRVNTSAIRAGVVPLGCWPRSQRVTDVLS